MRIELYFKNFRKGGAVHFFDSVEQMLPMSDFNSRNSISGGGSVVRRIALRAFSMNSIHSLKYGSRRSEALSRSIERSELA